MPQAISTTLLRGGLNLIVPAIAMKPGNCIAAQNYEPQVRGYSRVDGYERFDGRPQPHKASYSLLNFRNGSVAVTAGQTVTGATSGATGVALYAGTLSAGSYGGGTATGHLVLFRMSGTFQDGENLQVSASTVAIITRSGALGGAASAGVAASGRPRESIAAERSDRLVIPQRLNLVRAGASGLCSCGSIRDPDQLVAPGCAAQHVQP